MSADKDATPPASGNRNSVLDSVKQKIWACWSNPGLTKERLEVVSEAASLVTKGGAAIGCLLLFINWSTGHYVPAELSLGDTALLLFVFFTFGILHIAGMALGIWSTIWMVKSYCVTINLFRRKTGRRLQLKYGLDSGGTVFYSLVAFLLLTVTVGLSVYLHPNVTQLYLLSLLLLDVLVGLAVNGLLITSQADAPNDDAYSKSRLLRKLRGVFFGVVIATCFPLVLFPAKLSEIILRIDGIRVEDHVVILSNENFKKLSYAASVMGADVLSCAPSPEGSHAVVNLDLRWHGVGKTTYVLLKQRDKDKDETWLDKFTKERPYLEVPLSSEGVWPIKTGGGERRWNTPCNETNETGAGISTTPTNPRVCSCSSAPAA